jgi:hypothetical protein
MEQKISTVVLRQHRSGRCRSHKMLPRGQRLSLLKKLKRRPIPKRPPCGRSARTWSPGPPWRRNRCGTGARRRPSRSSRPKVCAIGRGTAFLDGSSPSASADGDVRLGLVAAQPAPTISPAIAISRAVAAIGVGAVIAPHKRARRKAADDRSRSPAPAAVAPTSMPPAPPKDAFGLRGCGKFGRTARKGESRSRTKGSRQKSDADHRGRRFQ